MNLNFYRFKYIALFEIPNSNLVPLLNRSHTPIILMKPSLNNLCDLVSKTINNINFILLI